MLRPHTYSTQIPRTCPLNGEARAMKPTLSLNMQYAGLYADYPHHIGPYRHPRRAFQARAYTLHLHAPSTNHERCRWTAVLACPFFVSHFLLFIFWASVVTGVVPSSPWCSCFLRVNICTTKSPYYEEAVDAREGSVTSDIDLTLSRG